MMHPIQIVTILVIAATPIGLAVYSYKKCGWGAFAYEYPIIAAFTQECAQQQRLLQSTADPVARPPSNP